MVILFIIALVAIIIVIRSDHSSGKGGSNPTSNDCSHTQNSEFINYNEVQKRYAGECGELYAAQSISGILRPDDVHLKNINLNINGQRAEYDNIIINQYGVFVIEVKNWVGEIFGDEEDRTWEKRKEICYGYYKSEYLKNPIQQVTRQAAILEKYLRGHYIDILVDGYVYFLHDNCPVYSPNVVSDIRGIDNVIHGYARDIVSAGDVENIRKLLVDANIQQRRDRFSNSIVH